MRKKDPGASKAGAKLLEPKWLRRRRLAGSTLWRPTQWGATANKRLSGQGENPAEDMHRQVFFSVLVGDEESREADECSVSYHCPSSMKTEAPGDLALLRGRDRQARARAN